MAESEETADHAELGNDAQAEEETKGVSAQQAGMSEADATPASSLLVTDEEEKKEEDEGVVDP